ncbi:hypothetical protein BKA83DRAFT_4246611, partial [Pisolithus microcarpus]
MRRDDNRCMLTGDRDYQDGGLIRIGIAHAIPQITNKNIIEEGKKVGYFSISSLLSTQLMNLYKQFHPVSAGAILSIFTDININILEDLADNRIYRLEKITSVEQACNRAFDELVLWLKPMEVRSQTYLFPLCHSSLSVTSWALPIWSPRPGHGRH